MAALGSALSTQLRAPSAQWKAKAKRATKARCAVRAASTENKIEDVAAAVDPKALLPEGLYCESNYKAIRRPTRYARRRRERRRAIAGARETRDRPRDICEIQRRRNKRALHPSSCAYGSARRPRLTSRPLFLRRTVTVGDVKLGSEHPIVRQTMTTSDTRDVEATVAEVRLPLVISPRACLFFAV